MGEERSEVHCFSAILSEQDLERVVGLSGRAFQASKPCHLRTRESCIPGFRLTIPSSEKYPLPLSFSWPPVSSAPDGGAAHGVGSSCWSIMSSILASPQGASEQYMWILMLSRIVNGWRPRTLDLSSSLRQRIYGDLLFLHWTR